VFRAKPIIVEEMVNLHVCFNLHQGGNVFCFLLCIYMWMCLCIFTNGIIWTVLGMFQWIFFRWIAFGTRKNLFALGVDLDYVTDTGYKYNNLVISSWSPCEGLFPVFAV